MHRYLSGVVRAKFAGACRPRRSGTRYVGAVGISAQEAASGGVIFHASGAGKGDCDHRVRRRLGMGVCARELPSAAKAAFWRVGFDATETALSRNSIG